jgi:predicted ArsR family transcriptional regulator
MTTRNRIIQYLEKVREAHTGEIARALSLSKPNVRHHLRVLILDKRVESKAMSVHLTRGRPEKSYSLSRAAQGSNLSRLTDVLLNVEKSKIKWDLIAGKLAGDLPISKLPITALLRDMILKMNEMHYQARWEAGAEGPRVILGYCPYAEIIESHPELCNMDTMLLSRLLTTKVEQKEKIQKNRGVCIFVLGHSSIPESSK